MTRKLDDSEGVASRLTIRGLNPSKASSLGCYPISLSVLEGIIIVLVQSSSFDAKGPASISLVSPATVTSNSGFNQVVHFCFNFGLTFDPLQAVVFEEGGTEDETFREMVDVAVQRLYDTLNPVF